MNAPNKKPPECTVGELRQQTALCDAKRRVVLVRKSPTTGKLISTPYRVVCAYPDTTDEHGHFESAFKLEIEDL